MSCAGMKSLHKYRETGVGAARSMYSRGDRCHRRALARVRFNDDPVLAHLLLDQDDLFCALDHKVTSWIERTLSQLGHSVEILSRQNTSIASKHDGDPANPYSFAPDDFPVAHVLDIHCDGCGVGGVS